MKPADNAPRPNLMSLLKPYKGLILGLFTLSLLSNTLSLSIPKRVANGIDTFSQGTFSTESFVLAFLGTAVLILIFAYLQSLVQIYASERVARDLRTKLAAKISRQSVASIQEVTPSKLLTNLTSDIDAVKLFVSQAIVSIVSSVFIIIGASALLISLNWKLALAVLVILPLIALTFFKIFSKVGGLFKESQHVIDRLNKVINESILGSALIRVLNAQQQEFEKFLEANTEAKTVGLKILRIFASAIPVINFLGSMAMLVVIAFGGHLAITGEMTIGELAAFNGYLTLLIFPILIIGFMSNAISRANASYARVSEVLNLPEEAADGTLQATLRGDIEIEHLSLSYAGKPVLKDVSFSIKAGTKTAIIGPTAAGKTQLLQLMTGLLPPTSGKILFDGQPLTDYDHKTFHAQVGFVFQDSVLFNLSLRENIAFSEVVDPARFEKAVATAELTDFIETLPDKLETLVSERGTSLSGGQKQRVMLARALALDPKILLLDDFTARVDPNTEQRILNNVETNYPALTLISITQKIAPIETYDQIILLMEGEVVAKGTHTELMRSCPEYVQIAQSQRSTDEYESSNK
jgi:ATP-binding cassette subfamily B protein